MSWWQKLWPFSREAASTEATFRQNLEEANKKAEEVDVATQLIQARNNVRLRALQISKETQSGRKRQPSSA